MASKRKRSRRATKSLRPLSMSVAEHEALRRSVSLLAEIHVARGRVRGKARKALDRLEARVLDQLEVLEAASFTEKKLSGASWVSEFLDSKATSALTAVFGKAVDKFIAAMKAGGATVSIETTHRPAERAHLMHYAWRVSRKEIAASDVPAKTGVDIEWVHPTDEQSVQAAKDMVAGYKIVAKPSLTSRHTEKLAIDMTISWSGTLSIEQVDGTTISIATTPRTGENADLIGVGAGYGVVKATFSGDPPHWSSDGH